MAKGLLVDPSFAIRSRRQATFLGAKSSSDSRLGG
jgi:hypothetical protein